MTPVEAQAAGCPVIALRAGGALETVVDDQTGKFFDEQNSDALAETILEADRIDFDPKACAAQAAGFATHHFCRRLHQYLSEVMTPPQPLSLMSA